jgi:hypothetical protein
MPANFGPPECVVIADRSSVTAGGIVTFHPSPIAVRLKGDDRLCDSLILSVQELFPLPFDKEKPAVTRLRLRGVPCILLSGLSSPHSSVKSDVGREFGFQGTRIVYHNPVPQSGTGRQLNFFAKNFSHRFCTFRCRKLDISLCLLACHFSWLLSLLSDHRALRGI